MKCPILVLALMLSGCAAPTHWVNDNSSASFSQDDALCKIASSLGFMDYNDTPLNQETATWAAENEDVLNTVDGQVRLQLCLERHGWREDPG